MIAFAGTVVFTSGWFGAMIVPVGEKVTVPPMMCARLGMDPAEPRVRVAVCAPPGVTVTYVAPEPVVSVPTVSLVFALPLPKRLIKPPFETMPIVSPMRSLLFPATALSRFRIVPAPRVMPEVLSNAPFVSLRVSVPVKTDVLPA